MAATLHFYRLSCGMPVCIQTTGESKLVSLSVWIDAGSSLDPLDKGGLAHLCEHLLLRPLMCNDSREQRFQQKTGALVNAHTGPEWVVISAQAPVEQSKSLIDLLSALVRNPHFESNGLEIEKKIINQELKDKEPDLAAMLARAFQESAFADNPWVQPVGGTPATLVAIQPEDVQSYYARSLVASRMLITAHGDIDASDLTSSLDEAFTDFPETSLPAGINKSETTMEVRPPPAYRPVRISKETSNAGPVSGYGLLAGLPSVPRGTEEYWTALAFEVLMADGPGSLLSGWLRNDTHQVYDAVSMTEAYEDWGCQYFLIRISEYQVEEAIDHLGEQWKALPESVTNERVEMLRNRYATRALSSLAQMQDRMILMRDIALSKSREPGSLEEDLENFVTRNVQKLTSHSLLSYIRRYAEWDRVSLVYAPI